MKGFVNALSSNVLRESTAMCANMLVFFFFMGFCFRSRLKQALSGFPEVTAPHTGMLLLALILNNLFVCEKWVSLNVNIYQGRKRERESGEVNRAEWERGPPDLPSTDLVPPSSSLLGNKLSMLNLMNLEIIVNIPSFFCFLSSIEFYHFIFNRKYLVIK